LDTVGPMNQRESSGLPIRAMVMVLLFLGVAFLLVGWNATRSSNDSESTESSSVTTVTSTNTSSSTSPTSPPPAANVDVWVFNTSGVNGAGADVVARLVRPNWTVPEAGTRDHVEGVDVTTVYYPASPPSYEAAAREIGD